MSGYLHPEHGIKVDRNSLGFVGVCSCGFRGTTQKNSKQASGDLGKHLADIWIEQNEFDGRGNDAN